jgi:ribosome-associated protein
MRTHVLKGLRSHHPSVIMKPMRIELPSLEREVKFEAVRSRGPGGQNVNKVSSAAVLFWNVGQSSLLNVEQKQRISDKLQNHMNREGEVFVRSDEFRDLERNKARSLEKLQDMIQQALHRPKPRRPTKPTKSSRLKRLDSKKRRGQTKKLRGSTDF